MRIRQIAAMASGHDQQTLGQALALDSREPVRGFLLIPPDRPPGTVFAYNQPCTFPGDTAPDGHPLLARRPVRQRGVAFAATRWCPAPGSAQPDLN
jgi:hypothetical protein